MEALTVKLINLSVVHADNSGLQVNSGLRFYLTNSIQDYSFLIVEGFHRGYCTPSY